MITRRFGRTELDMPLFSCGGMRYQHKWQDVPLDEVPPEGQANLEATIHRAIELGICHIETARGYGSSERQLGLVLPRLPRKEIIVQTKISPCADPAKFAQQFHESLDRLQLDHVDLLGLHGVNTYEHLWWSIRPGGCLATARQLVAEGKVGHIGFSTHGPLDLILSAIRHEEDGGFDYVNLHWYYIFQNNWPAVLAASERDLGLFIISPSDKGGMLYQPPEKLIELCQPLHPLVFNALFCLSRPEIHTLSLGAARPSDFDLQMSAIELLPKMAHLLPPIEQRLRAAMVDAVGEKVANRFAEGLPAWEDAPGHMNMPVMLWLRNLALAYDMLDYGQMRYNLLGNGGHWFPGLPAAHLDDFDLSKSLKNSPFAEQVPGWLQETHALLGKTPQVRLSQT